MKLTIVFFGKTKTKLYSIFIFIVQTLEISGINFYLAEDLTLPPETLQAAVFGFSEKDNTENVILYNHIFLIFKLYVYGSRGKGFLNVMILVNQIIKIKKTEKENSL